MQEFINIATEKDSDRPTLVNIKRLADIILPKIVPTNKMSEGLKDKPKEHETEKTAEVEHVEVTEVTA